MRLEPFCKFTMRYTHSSWHRPYGRAGGEGEEGLGFGSGDGQVAGEIEGGLVWTNYPRRREDGVWTPNVRGFITTSARKEILVAMHGQSVLESGSGYRRAILVRVELTTQEEQYQWLNTCFLVGEGEIDEERGDLSLTTYVCVNEEAQGSPAIGAEHPERLRQRGTAPSS